MNKVHVKTGDTVVVINGKNRGRKGKVMQVSPAEDKVIVKAESALYASKVQLVCPKCGAATRVGHTKVENKNGKTVSMRVCKKCGAQFE